MHISSCVAEPESAFVVPTPHTVQGVQVRALVVVENEPATHAPQVRLLTADGAEVWN